MSHSQMGRIYEIDRMIRDGEYPNAESVAAHFEVGRRVVFNDRRFLVERLGAPLEFDRARGGWYYREATWALPSAMITQGELLAFFLSVEVARRNFDGALEAPLKQAVAKIARTLPEEVEVEVELDDLRVHYSFAAPSSAGADETTLLALHEAIRRQRETEIFYHAFSTGEFKRRVVQPYHLHNSRGDWYLIAFDHLRQDLRIFHVGRIARFKLLDTGFVHDANAWGDPARPGRDGDLVQASLKKFGDHVAALTAGFNLEAQSRCLLAPEYPDFAIADVTRSEGLNALCEH